MGSILGRLGPGGLFVASIRDYDSLLTRRPPYGPPYIHPTDKGQRVAFQTWAWNGDVYRLTQYIIEDGETLEISRSACELRAMVREELTGLLLARGCREAFWLFPEDTGFYQPIVIGKT